MNRYYVEYPRDFCNEYTVYVVPAEDVERFEKLIPGARRIARAEAVRLGINRPREAKRAGEQWFGGLIDGAASNTWDWKKLQTLAGRLEAAESDTLSELHRRELEAEAAAEWRESFREQER